MGWFQPEDFILTHQCFKFSINKANTRSNPGVDIGSDHDLMLTTIKVKLKTKCFMTSPHIQFDLEKLQDPKIAEMFQAKVGGKFAALCVLDNDVDTLANSLKQMLLSTAEEVLWRQRKKILPWVTNEVVDLCDQRRQLRQEKYISTEAGLEYGKVNREVRKKMKIAKEEWTEEQCKNIEKGMMSGNIKEAYKYNTLKALTITQQHNSAVIDYSSGNILTESTAVLNW